MPTYQYKNEETGEISDHFMSIAKMEQFDIDNPHMKKIIHAPAIGDSVRLGIKRTPDSFNDMLKTIKKTNAGSDINTR
tara:strand:- start:3724 stop:3957 length:234 start_codon:yes stop_codon:yes gene_type:complete